MLWKNRYIDQFDEGEMQSFIPFVFFHLSFWRSAPNMRILKQMLDSNKMEKLIITARKIFGHVPFKAKQKEEVSFWFIGSNERL